MVGCYIYLQIGPLSPSCNEPPKDILSLPSLGGLFDNANAWLPNVIRTFWKTGRRIAETTVASKVVFACCVTLGSFLLS